MIPLDKKLATPLNFIKIALFLFFLYAGFNFLFESPENHRAKFEKVCVQTELSCLIKEFNIDRRWVEVITTQYDSILFRGVLDSSNVNVNLPVSQGDSLQKNAGNNMIFLYKSNGSVLIYRLPSYEGDSECYP